MTAPQPLRKIDALQEAFHQAMRFQDHEEARGILAIMQDAHHKTGELYALKVYLTCLTYLNHREGIAEFNKVVSKGLELDLSNQDSIDFFLIYAFLLSRLRYRIGESPEEANQIALNIVRKFARLKSSLITSEHLAFILFVLFENEMDEELEAMANLSNLTAEFFLMQIKALNGKTDESYQMLMKLCDFYPDWGKKKSVKQLIAIINDLFLPFNIFYKILPKNDKPLPSGIVLTVKGTDKSRISKGISVIGDLARSRFANEVETLHKPVNKSPDLLQKILVERAAVFSELAHR